jgi:hypothetical protein
VLFCFQSFLRAAKLNFFKIICHLSFLMADPFIDEGSGHDRCRVTDPFHLSSVSVFAMPPCMV